MLNLTLSVQLVTMLTFQYCVSFIVSLVFSQLLSQLNSCRTRLSHIEPAFRAEMAIRVIENKRTKKRCWKRATLFETVQDELQLTSFLICLASSDSFCLPALFHVMPKNPYNKLDETEPSE